jgi:hypothetical protein
MPLMVPEMPMSVRLKVRAAASNRPIGQRDPDDDNRGKDEHSSRDDAEDATRLDLATSGEWSRGCFRSVDLSQCIAAHGPSEWTEERAQNCAEDAEHQDRGTPRMVFRGVATRRLHRWKLAHNGQACHASTLRARRSVMSAHGHPDLARSARSCRCARFHALAVWVLRNARHEQQGAGTKRQQIRRDCHDDERRALSVGTVVASGDHEAAQGRGRDDQCGSCGACRSRRCPARAPRLPSPMTPTAGRNCPACQTRTRC